MFWRRKVRPEEEAIKGDPGQPPVHEQVLADHSVTGMVSSVSEVEMKLEDQQKQINNLYLVNELSQRITASLSMEDSFNHLYQTLNSMMDASVAELVVIDGNGRQFFSNKKYPEEVSGLGTWNHFSEWTLTNRKEVYLEDAEMDFGRYVYSPLTLPDGKPARSLMCFPVFHQAEIRGSLCIISFNKHAFEPFHRDMVNLLLPFIGVAITNAFNHQEMIGLKQRAERSEQFMQIFLANMSHEIRTPMNAVVGMTSILLQKEPRPDQQNYLDTIQRSSENLLVILNDILDLSKIEAGKIELETIGFSLSEVIRNAGDIIGYKAGEKGLEFNVITDPGLEDNLMGDPTRLTQVLLNLLGNAVKFTDKGSVTLHVKRWKPDRGSSAEVRNGDTESLVFEISDTGIGMDEEQQGRLFSDFMQASAETTRKYGGTGLGLSISRQLVQLQGGDIWVKSSPGAGSVFSFRLTFRLAAGKPILPGGAAEPVEIGAMLKGKRLLLVDDNTFNRIVVRESLELKISDVQIDEAESGRDALDLLKQNNYDIVMLDLIMPEMSGIETVGIIREEFPAPKNRVPVVAITASVQKQEIEACMAAGMNGFIPKPFKINDLIITLCKVLHEAENEPEVVKSKASPADSVIDRQYVDDISEGDQVRVKRYAALFLNNTPSQVDSLKEGVAGQDFEKVRLAAHSLKSVMKFNGVLGAAEILEAMEQTAREGQGDLSHHLERFLAIYELALKEIGAITSVS